MITQRVHLQTYPSSSPSPLAPPRPRGIGHRATSGPDSQPHTAQRLPQVLVLGSQAVAGRGVPARPRVPARPGICNERGGKDPSGLASKVTESWGRCIDEGGLAERAGPGVSARPGAAGKTKDAGSFSCRILGGREVRRVCLRKGKEVRVSAQEQSACAACFHLGMGGRGGAPRVAERQESPLKPEPARRWLARHAPCCWHALDWLLPGRQHRFRGSPPWCSAEQDLARLLSLLHTPAPAAPPHTPCGDLEPGICDSNQPLQHAWKAQGFSNPH